MADILSPLNSIILVEETGPKNIQKKEICIDLVGEKGFGLSCLPEQWTLPFYIINNKLYDTINSVNDIESAISDWSAHLYAAASLVNFESDEKIIIRSCYKRIHGR